MKALVLWRPRVCLPAAPLCGRHQSAGRQNVRGENDELATDQDDYLPGASDRKETRKHGPPGLARNCLKAKPAAEPPKSKMAMCNEKTKGMTKVDADKAGANA